MNNIIEHTDIEKSDTSRVVLNSMFNTSIGYNVSSTSHKKNKISRLIHELFDQSDISKNSSSRKSMSKILLNAIKKTISEIMVKESSKYYPYSEMIRKSFEANSIKQVVNKYSKYHNNNVNLSDEEVVIRTSKVIQGILMDIIQEAHIPNDKTDYDFFIDGKIISNKESFQKANIKKISNKKYPKKFQYIINYLANSKLIYFAQNDIENKVYEYNINPNTCKILLMYIDLNMRKKVINTIYKIIRYSVNEKDQIELAKHMGFKNFYKSKNEICSKIMYNILLSMIENTSKSNINELIKTCVQVSTINQKNNNQEQVNKKIVKRQ